MEIRKYLVSQSLHINSSFEEGLINSFCATTNTDRRKRVLKNWYEGYLYTVSLGMIKNRRVPFKGKEKQQKATWSTPNYIRQYEFLMSKLLTRKEILVELNLLSPMKDNIEEKTKEVLIENYTSEDSFDKDIFYRKVFDQLKDICDEYMNGGLQYLSERKESGDSFVDETQSLVNYLRNN